MHCAPPPKAASSVLEVLYENAQRIGGVQGELAGLRWKPIL